MTRKTSVPHSWTIATWPADVYPNDVGRGRYLVRCNRDALRRAGALVRVGRELVVMGGPYDRWLSKQAARVPGYGEDFARVPSANLRGDDEAAA